MKNVSKLIAFLLLLVPLFSVNADDINEANALSRGFFGEPLEVPEQRGTVNNTCWPAYIEEQKALYLNAGERLRNCMNIKLEQLKKLAGSNRFDKNIKKLENQLSRCRVRYPNSEKRKQNCYETAIWQFVAKTHILAIPALTSNIVCLSKTLIDLANSRMESTTKYVACSAALIDQPSTTPAPTSSTANTTIPNTTVGNTTTSEWNTTLIESTPSATTTEPETTTDWITDTIGV